MNWCLIFMALQVLVSFVHGCVGCAARQQDRLEYDAKFCLFTDRKSSFPTSLFSFFLHDILLRHESCR